MWREINPGPTVDISLSLSIWHWIAVWNGIRDVHIWTRGSKNQMKTCLSISWNPMLRLKGSLSIISYHVFHHIHRQNWIRFFLSHQDWISLCPYCFYMDWFTKCSTKRPLQFSHRHFILIWTKCEEEPPPPNILKNI